MAAKSIVRIHLMDDSVKTVAIDKSTTAEELKAIIKEKIEILEDECFAIVERKDGWERCLEPDEKPAELMASWKPAATDKEKQEEEPDCFLYKKKIFLQDDSKEMKDPKAKHLVYIQAVASVISSEYPSTPEEAVRLAGLQMQVVYGDHNPTSHSAGFLLKNLKEYVPKDLIATKKPAEWEAAILKAHTVLIGKNAEDAKTEYLDIVKCWPFYGATFFPPCKATQQKNTGKKLPNKLIIGVNADGIFLLKKDKEVFSTHQFTEIWSWSSSNNSFAFEFSPSSSQTESQRYTFETKQGAVIAATIQTYINILVDLLESPEEEN